jgi:hypothetical protein
VALCRDGGGRFFFAFSSYVDRRIPAVVHCALRCLSLYNPCACRSRATSFRHPTHFVNRKVFCPPYCHIGTWFLMASPSPTFLLHFPWLFRCFAYGSDPYGGRRFPSPLPHKTRGLIAQSCAPTIRPKGVSVDPVVLPLLKTTM